MNKNKRSVALVVLLVLSLLAGGVQRPVAAIPTALPASPVDESKVPHYYGPYPNWALSPLTTADVAVEIVGDGSGATASATVGANGALTGIQITNPGRGYTTASVNIIGAGTGALADAVLTSSGAVVAITVDASGSGYRIPVVTITGGVGYEAFNPRYLFLTPEALIGNAAAAVPRCNPTPWARIWSSRGAAISRSRGGMI